MDKKLNVTIINAIKNIIERAPEEVNYDVSKYTENAGIFNTKPNFRITKVTILIREPI